MQKRDDGAPIRLIEMLRESGATRRTLRVYEQQGLLLPAGRDRFSRRIYTRTDLLRLRLIRMFRDAGLPLSAIREILDARVVQPTDNAPGLWIDRAIGALIRYRDALAQQRAVMVSTETKMEEALTWLGDHRRLATEQPQEVMEDDEIPLLVRALVTQPQTLATAEPKPDKRRRSSNRIADETRPRFFPPSW